MNNVELVQTLSWRENALFEERKRTACRCLKPNRALAPIGSLYRLGFNISEIERSLSSLWCLHKINIPLIYEVQNNQLTAYNLTKRTTTPHYFNSKNHQLKRSQAHQPINLQTHKLK